LHSKLPENLITLPIYRLAQKEQEKTRLLINRQSPFAGGGHKQGLMIGGLAFRHPRSPLDVIHRAGRSRHQSMDQTIKPQVVFQTLL
jgi:hypothetical protein